MIMQFEDAIIHDNKIKRGIAMDSLFTKWWKEGKAEGKSEAEANITTLFSKLFELGRAADVERASKDNDYLQKLKTEFLVPENA